MASNSIPNRMAVLAPVLLAMALAAPPARGAAPEALDEVVVTGERSGPGLWHLRHGDAELWILGSLSPLPKGITWRSTEVERVITTAQAIVVGKPLDLGFTRALWIFLMHHDLLVVSGGRSLRDLLPPELYQRFATQRAKYTSDSSKWERFRPILAAVFLEETAFHDTGLSTHLDIGAAVRTLAKKHDVRIDEVSIASVGDLLDALKTVPAATENKCLGAALSTIEVGLPRLVKRANAWALGDIGGMQRLPDSMEDLECRAALTSDPGSADLIGRIKRAWLAAIDEHMRASTATLAVVNLDLLLEKGGLLDELQARGYAVVGAP